MKKVLCFAAAALTLFAACQKTTVVYDNSEPQEIAVFAVNKTATKAPVAGTDFPDDYDMQVAAYLAAGDGVTTGDYFDGTTFTKGETNWAGGKYWPVSAATLNFLAVAPQVEATATAAEDETAGATITTVFGTTPVNPTAEGGDETPEKTNYVSQSVTTVTNNDANQYDVMYAVVSASKVAGSAPSAVGMTFNHAYAWLDFKFSKTNDETGAPTIKINSVTVNGVATDGTLTVTIANYNSSEDNLTASQSWTSTVDNDGIVVPAVTDTEQILTKDETLTTTPTQYYNGLLLIPEHPMTSFVINYTTTVGGVSHTFDYTYNAPTTPSWTAGYKYTYDIKMSFSQIEVSPSVSTWEDYDADSNTEGNQPIEVNTNTNTNTPAN